ncbi:MAG: ATP-binding cassette domain-containing protein [Eubacteriales bacterium]|nr:ATP-binding cassette domain-containing protein [Eubacteriales bacterium]
MIEITDLTKYYGPNLAVDNITFTVEKGEILGFLGPNGAGKSTTMNILTGYLSATSGSVKINGHDILEEPQLAKRSIGYLPENPPLYLDMTAMEFLQFVADLKGVKRADRARHLAEIMKMVKITDVANRLIKNLSKGYKQRVGIAQAMVGNPEVLVLDEPTVGLDPKQIIEIRTLIKELGKQHTVILSSHILPEVSAVCDRVVIISRGKIVAVNTTENLSKQYSKSGKFRLTVEGPTKEIVQSLRMIPGVKSASVVGERQSGSSTIDVENDTKEDIRKQVFFEMARHSWPILEMRSMDATLEDIFLKATAGVAISSEEEVEQ